MKLLVNNKNYEQYRYSSYDEMKIHINKMINNDYILWDYSENDNYSTWYEAIFLKPERKY